MICLFGYFIPALYLDRTVREWEIGRVMSEHFLGTVHVERLGCTYDCIGNGLTSD
jgi:hypothetical protein